MTLSVAISHRFPGFTMDVEFTTPQGVTALFGRSGAGKTTVVQTVAGLLRPDAGRVVVGDWVLVDTASGRWLPPHRRRIGYVFQEGRLFPHLTVRQNLLYGRYFAAQGHTREFEPVVEMLGIDALLRRRPGDLSGGEKQRVAIGRALLSGPRLLLLDEPLAGLDQDRKAEILPFLERLRDNTDIPMLYVSHSVSEVARVATSVVALEDGVVRHSGPASAVLSDPDAVPALGIREAGSILTGRIVAHHVDGLTEVVLSAGPIFLPRIDAMPDTTVRVRIAARDVILARDRPEGLSALNIIPAQVVALRKGSGTEVLVRLRLAGDLLLARITRRAVAAMELAPGVPCYVIVKTVSVGPVDVGAA